MKPLRRKDETDKNVSRSRKIKSRRCTSELKSRKKTYFIPVVLVYEEKGTWKKHNWVVNTWVSDRKFDWWFIKFLRSCKSCEHIGKNETKNILLILTEPVCTDIKGTTIKYCYITNTDTGMIFTVWENVQILNVQKGFKLNFLWYVCKMLRCAVWGQKEKSYLYIFLCLFIYWNLWLLNFFPKYIPSHFCSSPSWIKSFLPGNRLQCLLFPARW